MPFNFPDPAVSTTATNPVTGATYQWKDDPGKWVLTGGAAEKPTPPVTIDLLPPEDPQVGDLWIHAESLIEYAWDGTQWFEVGSSCGGKAEEEEEEESIAPFVNSYRLVSPDDFTGENGTAALETDAYAGGADSYLSPAVQIARFAPIDLNGKKHEHVSVDESFELSSTEVADEYSRPYIYGKYKVTKHLSYNEYTVDFDSSRAFRFVEGETIYYRPSFTGDYVKKEGGDTMEGPLQVAGPRKAGDDVDNPDLVSSVKVLSIDNTQNSSLQLRHSGNAKVYIGSTDVSIASDIKFNRAAGSVVKTNVQDILNIREREIAYLGESIEDEDLITKKYVDDTKEFLQNEIIELEEEIEALAPSLERGSWNYTQPLQTRGYSLFDSGGNPTNRYTDATSIFISPTDANGTAHSFDNVTVGSYLEIFESGDVDFGLYQITAVDDKTTLNPGYWVFDVNHVKSNSVLATANGLARFKFFELADAADPTAFVLKTGDTMTGTLRLDGDRSINAVSGKIGNLKYNGYNRLGWGQTQVFVSGELVIQDPGGAVGTGAIKMNNKKIYGLADPVNDQDAATKAYVDDSLDFSKYPELS